MTLNKSEYFITVDSVKSLILFLIFFHFLSCVQGTQKMLLRYLNLKLGVELRSLRNFRVYILQRKWLPWRILMTKLAKEGTKGRTG